jgi:hypothetical protein
MNTFFTSNATFEKEFQRCCKEYNRLEMYVAWVSNPKAIIPFEYLYNLSKITAVVGVAFCQTHPNGLKFLIDIKADLRIAEENVLYHPKIYIFSNENNKAIFIGSSNFTYHGFYENQEANVLIEGSSDDKLINQIEKDVQKWRTKEYSFKPDEKWLKKYTERHKKRMEKIKKAGLKDEAEVEEKTANSSAWLNKADWDFYIRKVNKGIRNHSNKYHESFSLKIALLNRCANELPLPWKTDYFKDLDKRKLIGGMNPYGWLGHVGASGDFRRMLANGTSHEYKTIVNSINTIAKLSTPLEWVKLKKYLKNLIDLGPTMKVWGRLLAIVRPDLFCTISSPQVRKNIAKTLGKPEKYFEEVDGYLCLLRLVHSSPWYNSEAPTDKDEFEIWKRRVAFLDVVFYE